MAHCLGVGSQGTVLASKDGAVKHMILEKGLLSQPGLREVWTSAVLPEHPLVQRYHMLEFYPDRVAIRSQRYGQTIGKWREKHDLSFELWLRLAVEMSVALAHLHEHGIAHYDFQTNNICFRDSKQDHFVLIDLGLSLPLEVGDAESIGSVLCQPVAMRPPELLCNAEYGRLSSAADVWALGMMLLSMWFGSLLLTDREADAWKQLLAIWGKPSSDWRARYVVDGEAPPVGDGVEQVEAGTAQWWRRVLLSQAVRGPVKTVPATAEQLQLALRVWRATLAFDPRVRESAAQLAEVLTGQRLAPPCAHLSDGPRSQFRGVVEALANFCSLAAVDRDFFELVGRLESANALTGTDKSLRAVVAYGLALRRQLHLPPERLLHFVNRLTRPLGTELTPQQLAKLERGLLAVAFAVPRKEKPT